MNGIQKAYHGEKVEIDRVVEFELSEDRKLMMVMEMCDQFFCENFDKEGVAKMIDLLQDIHDKMV